MWIHLSSFCFAWMGLVVKWLGNRLPADEMSLFRTLFPAVLLTPLLIRAAGSPAFRKALPILLLRGFLGSLSLILYFKSLLLIDYATASLLCYTSPLFTAFFAAVFLKEAPSRRTLVGLPLAFLGVVCVVQPSGAGGNWLGPAYALLSGISAGGAYVSVRSLVATVQPALIVAVFMWVAVALSLPLVAGQYVAPTTAEWAGLGLVALLATLGQLAMTLGYARYPAAQASTMNLSMVVFAALLGWLFMHEALGPLKVLGLTLTLSGVALVSPLSGPGRSGPLKT